jgi:LEA14-like dessication related protein
MQNLILKIKLFPKYPIMKYIIPLFFLIYHSSCISLKPVEFQGIESFQIIDQTDTSANVDIMVKIKNPNNYKLVIKKVDLDATLNKKPVGKINHKVKLIIPKNSEESYTLHLVADLLQLRRMIPTLIFTNTALVNIKGDIKGRALLIPKKIKLDVTQKVSRDDLKL